MKLEVKEIGNGYHVYLPKKLGYKAGDTIEIKAATEQQDTQNNYMTKEEVIKLVTSEVEDAIERAKNGRY